MREKERWGWGRGQIDGLRRERCAPCAGGWSQPAAMCHGRGRPIWPRFVRDREGWSCPARSPGQGGNGLAGGRLKRPWSHCAAPLADLRAKGPQDEGELAAQLLSQILEQRRRFLWISLPVNGCTMVMCVWLYESGTTQGYHPVRGSHLQSHPGQACSWSPSTMSTVTSFSANNWLARSQLLDFPKMEQVWSSSEALSWSSGLVLWRSCVTR